MVSKITNTDPDRADKMNPNNTKFWKARGYAARPYDWQEILQLWKDYYTYSKADLDNHSNQMNPNHDAFWQSRGYLCRPKDWSIIMENFEMYFQENEDDDYDDYANANDSSGWGGLMLGVGLLGAAALGAGYLMSQEDKKKTDKDEKK